MTNPHNATIQYYNEHAENFLRDTLDVDFSSTQNHFLSMLTSEAALLDFGCGSGRDTKYFIDRGFSVDANDGSEEMCRLAGEYTGIHVKHMYFQDLCEEDKYDGIWACASLLHLPRKELPAVIDKMITALKPNGIIYMSFKYGTQERIRNGRYFTDMTEKRFDNLVEGIEGIKIEEEWVTADIRPGRSEEKWLNIISRKIQMI